MTQVRKKPIEFELNSETFGFIIKPSFMVILLLLDFTDLADVDGPGLWADDEFGARFVLGLVATGGLTTGGVGGVIIVWNGVVKAGLRTPVYVDSCINGIVSGASDGMMPSF